MFIGLQFAQHRRANVEIEGIAQAQTIDDDIREFVGYSGPLVRLLPGRRGGVV